MDHADTAEGATTSGGGRVAYLAQAIWSRLADAETPSELAAAWLPLQCGMIDHAVEGLVAIASGEAGRLAPAAHWPEGRQRSSALAAVAEEAVSSGEGVIHSTPTSDGPGRIWAHVGYPLMSDGAVQGVIAVSLDNCSDSHVQSVLRQLQWGAGNLLAALGRADVERLSGVVATVTVALDLVGAAVSFEGFKEALMAVAATLAERTGSQRASVGLYSRGRLRVAAISGRSDVDQRTVLVRRMATAMDEAVQADRSIGTGEHFEEEAVAPSIDALARESGHESVLAVPLRSGSVAEPVGALLIESETAFDAATLRTIEMVAKVLGPLIEARRREELGWWQRAYDGLRLRIEALAGPENVGAKVSAVSVVLVLLFLAFARGEFRVNADTVLESSIQRVLAAPFDGYIATSVRLPGDRVSKGEELARLDDREPLLNRLRWERERARYQKELQQGRASGDRVQAELSKAKIAQTEAHLSLLDEQLERASLVAPFDGIVIDGDLSQSLGSPVRRGEKLFVVAPLDGYRVIVQVDERDITYLEAGQHGELRLNSLPTETFGFEVIKVTPVAIAEEGRNYFRVEGLLDEPSSSLRPGMEGVSKVVVGRHHLVWIWTHGLFDWLRLKSWAWLP